MQHLYLSYPERDRAFAQRLVADLQAAGYPVFVDAVSQAGTVSWAAETRRAIRAAGALLMILSPDEGRRVGTRHEGVLARRLHKPIYVVRRSPGDLPRYVQQAPVFDFSGDAYAAPLAALLAALPPAESLLAAPNIVPRRIPRRPPRHPQQARQRRRLVLALTALGVVAVAALVALVVL